MLAAIALAALAVFFRFAPPDPVAKDAPPEVFSAERAHAVLDGLIGDTSTHPTGSLANDEVRERIFQQLTQLGYAPERHSHVACGRFGDCMKITNVLATIEGGDDVVLVAAHYDSVGAGQGASDDGVGVAAVLEAARALQKIQPTNTIAFLFTDAEELGLHGATHFMKSRFARRVKAVVNVDNRGTSGPSLMFETAGPTSQIVPVLDALPRPLTSSLFGGVYEQLPNDTDFTRFRSRKAVGFNFAFIGDVAHYHTDRDSLANVSKASLQHHGENVLALTRAFSSLELQSLQKGERVVYFDWLGLFVVSWPETYSMPLSLVALLILGAALATRRRQKGWLTKPFATAGWGLATLLTSIVVGGLIALAIHALRDAPMPLHAALMVPAAAVLCATAAIVLHVGPAASKGAFWSRYGGAHLPLLMMGVAVASMFPPASHLFIVPAFAASIACAIGIERRSKGWERAALVAAAAFVTATMWFRVAIGIAAAVNVVALPIIGLAFGIVAIPLSLLIRKRPWRFRSMAAFGVLVYAIVAVVYPPYTESFPQRQSIVHFALDDEPSEMWIDTTWGPPSGEVMEVFEFAGHGPPSVPVIGMWNVAVAKTTPSQMDMPELELVSKSGNTSEVRLRSARQADTIGVLVPAQVGVRFDGRTVRMRKIEPPSRFAGMRYVLIRGAREDGVLLALTSAENIAQIYVFDVARELGAWGSKLQSARNILGVPAQEGDLSIRMRSTRL